MANTTAMCTSFKGELLQGIHALGPATSSATPQRTTAGVSDTLKAALILASGSAGAGTTNYSSISGSEVSGTGYTAGGIAVTTANAPTTSGTGAIFTPSASLVWAGLTLATAFDSVLIYNSSQSGKAISVHNFGSQTITAGTLTLTMPTNAIGTALLEID